MGIFSGLFKSRDKPENRTVGSSYAFYMGGSTSGKNVTERSAMQMTAVYSCVRILAEAVAGLPLHLYKYNADGGKEKAFNHPLYRLLHDEPNPEMSSFVFRETLMTHLLLWGNAYAQIMDTFIDIVVLKKSKDEEGFATTTYDAVASVRAYREGRHGSQRWANLAAFSEATDLFRFRTIPSLTVTTDHVIMTGGETFDITSVEDVKGRGMYVEVLAKKVVATVGKG